MTNSIKTKSGIEINPITSIHDLLTGLFVYIQLQYILECSILISTGTTFEEDRVAQGHLKSLGSAFQEISKTEEGQVMLVAMEGLATRIKVRFRIQWNME